MKLLFELSPAEMKGLDLSADERIYYCVPADLTYDNAKLLSRDAFAPDTYLIVTDQRLCVLTDGKLSYSVRLSDCEKIKCETQVHSGIVTVTERGKEPVCAARFSMKHIIRAGYVCRGAQKIIDARAYHTVKEAKNGEGPAPIRSSRGWIHLAHGVRGTAAGLRYVLYMYVTALDDPSRVIAAPGGGVRARRGCP